MYGTMQVWAPAVEKAGTFESTRSSKSSARKTSTPSRPHRLRRQGRRLRRRAVRLVRLEGRYLSAGRPGQADLVIMRRPADPSDTHRHSGGGQGGRLGRGVDAASMDPARQRARLTAGELAGQDRAFGRKRARMVVFEIVERAHDLEARVEAQEGFDQILLVPEPRPLDQPLPWIVTGSEDVVDMRRNSRLEPGIVPDTRRRRRLAGGSRVTNR